MQQEKRLIKAKCKVSINTLANSSGDAVPVCNHGQLLAAKFYQHAVLFKRSQLAKRCFSTRLNTGRSRIVPD